MRNKLSLKNFKYLSLMLFGMFFGSGNLIFPPMIGKLSGDRAFYALLSFSVSAILIPVLGIVVISKYGSIMNLGLKVNENFAKYYPMFIYLTVGPFLAIPRNGSIPLEIFMSYYGENENIFLYKLLFTIFFFIIVYFLSINPDNIIKKLGKYLTPILLSLIIFLFLGIYFNVDFKVINIENDFYTSPFIKGFIEGYNTMDIMAALNFGIVLSYTLNNLGIKEQKYVEKYSYLTGFSQASILFIIYAMLTYIGVSTSRLFPETKNGLEILLNSIRYIFGSFGVVIITSIFFVACLSVCISLIVSISKYFNMLYPKVKYRTWVIIYIFISLIISNLGLNNILKFSIPILLCINPISVVLVFLGLFSNLFNDSNIVFKYTILTTFIFSFISVVFNLFNVGYFLNFLPLNNLDLSWVLPTLLVFIILIFKEKLNV